jgi:uncharacterized protein YciI
MAYFFVKLIGPRPTFAMDMSDDERQLMVQHGKYLLAAYEAGKLHIYGPVMAHEGAFGMAVFDAADEVEVRRVMDEDPTVLAGMNRYEVYPMMIGALRGVSPTSKPIK